MKAKIIIPFGFIILLLVLIWLFPRKQEPEPIPINYELFDYRFQQLEKRIDSAYAQLNQAKAQNDSIKLQIIKDEKRIDNFGVRDLDSAFRTLF